MGQSEFIFNTADPAFAVDQELRIVLWNTGAEALLGFRAEEVLGQYCHEVIGCRDESGRLVCHENCMGRLTTLRQELVPTGDFPVRAKAGREIWVNISTVLIPSRRRGLRVLVHLLRDISRQKDMERFVERLHSNAAEFSSLQRPDPPSAPHGFPPVDLTRREQEILRLLASGASTRDLAKRLGISPATVRNHIKHLLAKLGAHSRLEAVTATLKDRPS